MWLAHPVHGDVLRSQLTPLRMATIARGLAEAAEAFGARRRTDVMRVAMWRLEGGGIDPLVMLEGARTARFRNDLELAERLARAAVEAGGRFDARLLAAQLAALQGRGEQAEAELAELATTLSTRGGEDDRLGPVTIARLDNLATYRGRHTGDVGRGRGGVPGEAAAALAGTGAVMTAFPEEFADLEHLGGWALGTEDARNRHRLSRSYAEVKDFYDTVLPRAEAILEYLNRFPLEDLPASQTRLLALAHALADAGPAGEWWQDVTYSKGFDPHRLLIHQ